jgi:hypothetical protein
MHNDQPKHEGRVQHFRFSERVMFYRGGHIARAVHSLDRLRQHDDEVVAFLQRARDTEDAEERHRIRTSEAPPGNPFALHDATVMYAAIAVEGFLNVYGTARLGEDYFRTYIERLGTEQKLVVLLAICTRRLVPNDAEIVRTLRSLFERRAALVHPKARVPQDMEALQAALKRQLYESKDAVAAVEEMKRFFDLMVTYDSDVQAFLEEEGSSFQEDPESDI